MCRVPRDCPECQKIPEMKRSRRAVENWDFVWSKIQKVRTVWWENITSHDYECPVLRSASGKPCRSITHIMCGFIVEWNHHIVVGNCSFMIEWNHSKGFEDSILFLNIAKMYLDLEWKRQPMVYTKHQTRSANLPKQPKIGASVLLSGLFFTLLSGLSYLDLLLSGPALY